MSVTTSFPGIYIQELPSNAHTIAAAPTSVTVFVGYSHPFKTASFGTPRELFSFSDYERLFGGFVTSGAAGVNDLPYAVSQFFLNGGGDAIVVGLKPAYNDPAKTAIEPGTTQYTTGGKIIQFTAREVTDKTSIIVTINNVNGAVADIVITYGNQQEVFRKVSLAATLSSGKPNPDFLETRIGTTAAPVSNLVTVASAGTGYPADFTFIVVIPPTPNNVQKIQTTIPAGTTGIFNPGDYTGVFQADTPLDKWPIFNLLVTPGVTDNGVLSEALAFCERKLAFFIMDPPAADVADPGTNWVGDFASGPTTPKSANGALYFPYIQSSDPSTGAPVNMAPSGTVAGIFARTDTNRGVWKAPAGLETTILNTSGVVPSGRMTDPRQGSLNDLGVNCLRDFPGVGTVVFGARTLVYPNTALRTQWGYVPVRRMALFLEQTLKLNLTWVIFEPNDEPLWIAIRTTIESFMLSLFHQGAFAGTKPSDSFQVKCDSTTTTPDDVNNGRVNIVVAFAPLKPAEFVIVKISQLAGQAQT